MPKIKSFQESSIGKKQVVAVTGLVLILFVIGHLAGNLFIFMGADAYIHYAEKLAGLRPGLFLVEAVLSLIFIIHMWITALLVSEALRARGKGYQVKKDVGNRSLATKLMPYTGTLIVVFVIYHLLDFTFINHEGTRSILIDGSSYKIYGVVINSFMDPLHSLLYIIVMMAVGLHLSHGIQSFVQTFGLVGAECFCKIRKASNLIGFAVALVYSSIPLYVLLNF